MEKPRRRVLTWSEARGLASQRGIRFRQHSQLFKKLFRLGLLTPQEAIQVEQDRIAAFTGKTGRSKKVREAAASNVSRWFGESKMPARAKYSRTVLRGKEAEKLMAELREKLSRRGYLKTLPQAGLSV